MKVKGLREIPDSVCVRILTLSILITQDGTAAGASLKTLAQTSLIFFSDCLLSLKVTVSSSQTMIECKQMYISILCKSL